MRSIRSSLALLVALGACSSEAPKQVVAGGDEARGRVYIERYGCASCHSGLPGAQGTVGPPLERIAHRAYLGGVLPNTPENMAAWVSRPQRYAPGTAMPDLGISEAEARDIAAYLYTLR
ncbi:MAG TPA: c-type cytochrome [Burkholderiales bacterium]|nr:c-type cytochrome [Burkholderiales bacterium]